MTFGLLLAAMMTMPQTDGAIADRFDAIELNHYFDDRGEHVFDQIILWTWDDKQNAFKVDAWRLWKTDRGPTRRFDGGWELIWYDSDVLRRVEAKVFWETWTQRDREMDDRRLHPKEHRRELTRPADHFQPTPSDEDLDVTPP